MGDIKFEIVTDIESNRDYLKKIWSEFDENNLPIPFQFEKLYSWYQKYGSIRNSRLGYKSRLLIVIGYKEKRPIIILPLRKITRKKYKILPIRYLEFLNQSLNGFSLDAITNGLTDSDIEKTISFVKKRVTFDFFRIAYLNEEGVLGQFFKKDLLAHAGKIVIPVDKGYEEIRKSVYSKNLRHVLNKFQRRINESDIEIKLEVLTNRVEIEKWKDQIKQVSLSKLSDGNMHSLYANEQMGEQYFREVLDFAEPFCAIAHSGGKLLSYNMGYIVNSRVYALDAAYNRHFTQSQKIGLGILAYDQVVQQFAGKAEFVDMGYGLDDYKFRFSKKIEISNQFFRPNNTLISRIMYREMLKGYRIVSNSVMQIKDKYD